MLFFSPYIVCIESVTLCNNKLLLFISSKPQYHPAHFKMGIKQESKIFGNPEAAIRSNMKTTTSENST